jgi:preprotein translocase subunit SecE
MEPISTALAAFAAVQKAVSLIKAAKNTVDDVASLGPLIGNYFEAKHSTVKALTEAKRSGGSNLGKAVEIEMALLSQAQFEEELKNMFWPHYMDVWEKIQERVAQMNEQDKHAERAARDRVKRAKQAKQEMIEIIAVVFAVVLCFSLVGGGIYMVYDHCQTAKCRTKK